MEKIMQYQIIKDAVMCQGLGAFGLLQYKGLIFLWGNTGKESQSPFVEIILFRPYSKNKFIFKQKIVQRFFDTTGYLYAIRFWRLVVYVDRGAVSLRYGGIVTSIGIARFLLWRFSWVFAS